MSHRVCSIDGCDRTTVARGWCAKHYAQWFNAGKPDTGIEAPSAPATDDEILHVARAHGTKTAATWAHRTEQHVLDLRHRIDSYYRGPGRPSAAELAARAPRLSCDCPYCIDWRSDEATRAAIRHAATEADQLIEPPGGWRREARCAGIDPDVFFPERVGPSSMYLYNDARAVCARCPVTEPCLRFAIDNRIEHGIYGGLDPSQRARIARDQPNDSDDDLRTQKRRGTRKPLTPDDPRHGTLNGYTNLACRCEPCREANRANGQQHWAARRATA